MSKYSGLLLVLILFGTSICFWGQMTDSLAKPILYVDSSGSMKSYVGGDYSALMNQLSVIFSNAGLRKPDGSNDYRVMLVGKEILEYKGTMSALSEGYLYKDKESNLYKIAEKLKSSNPRIPLAIVISDMEMDNAIVSQGQNPCSSGYDLSCLSTAFADLCCEPFNYSLYIVGFKTLCQGAVYPPRGARIPLTTPTSKAIYIMILADKGYAAKADELYKAFQSKLRVIKKDPNKFSEEVRAIKISPLKPPACKLGSSKQDLNNLNQLMVLYSSVGKKVIFAKNQYLITDKTEILEFKYQGNKMKLTDTISIEIPVTVISDPDNPDIYIFTGELGEGSDIGNVAKVIFDEKKSFNITLSCDVASNTFLGKEGKQLKLNINRNFKEIPFGIWQDWSTDNTASDDYRKKGKTLNISAFLDNILEKLVSIEKRRKNNSSEVVKSCILKFIP